MKRYIGYLFALVAIALFAAGCEKPAPVPPVDDPVHQVDFPKMTVTALENEASVVTSSAVYTIDGVTVENFEQGLEYRLKISSDWRRLSECEISGDTYIYTLFPLESDSEYVLRQWVRLTTGDLKYGAEQGFKTQKGGSGSEDYAVAVSVGKITPYGLYAQVELKSAKYLIGGVSSEIKSLKLEYSLSSDDDFQSVSINGWDYQSSLTVEIPSQGADYLIENSDYKFRLEISPADDSAPVLTSEEFTFSTVAAEVVSQIPSPEVTSVAEGLLVQGSGISIVKDGRFQEPISNIAVEYSKQGTATWDTETATVESQSYRAIIPAQNLLPETTYLIRVKVQTSDAVYYSDEVSYKTPKDENPEQPPQGGDTSMMEGVWKLTQWRGIQPDFEVYMEIDATGGVILWQRIDSRNWEQYLSAAYTEDGVISGVYDDGVAWGASYYYSVNGDSMTWTDTQDSSDVSVYQRSTLPEYLRKIQRSSQQTTALSRFL